ncbi:MAG: hypothetical protein KDC26_06905 [Armatimonadetes bacterium]|nr:hypothetical protein [Armatimonadota bacterium]
MKRVLAALIATAMVASVFAQAPFTIRRPADGSRVREVVTIRIPKNSIQAGQYVGFMINGKFLEAVAPTVSGDDYVYNLDTKGRKLPDGKMTIEAVLYQYSNDRPMVVDRSSVEVNLDNSTSITPGRGGKLLRYKFNPGKEWIYTLTDTTSVSTITQAQAQLGSRAAQIPVDTEKVRFMWAVDNVYNTANGQEGLIRVQALPNKGKDYTYLTLVGDSEPKKYMDYEMHPVYTRITSTGREIFSAFPTYFPLEGTGGEQSRLDLFLIYSMPILPSNAVNVAEPFQAAVPQSNFKIEDRWEVNDVFNNLPARGTVQGFEWESGMPCAKISSTLALGADDLKNMENLNQLEGEATKIELQTTYWFALDKGVVIKSITTMTQEALVEVGGSGGGFSGGGGPTGSDQAGGTGGRRQGGGRASLGAGWMTPNGFLSQLISPQSQMFRVQDGISGGPGGPPAGQNAGGVGARGGTGGNGSVGVKMIMRVQSRRVVELEK